MRERIRKMSKRSSLGLLLFGLLAVMIFSARIDKAWSYFTTFATAAGGYEVKLGDETTIKEKFKDWKKRLTIKSEAGSKPVYVRAKAFGSDDYPLEVAGAGWEEKNDGFWYYATPVEGGKTASELVVAIKDVPENVESAPDFNVVIVYESIPVLFKEDGTPTENNTPEYWSKHDDLIKSNTTKSE